jgi:hypothetical protein
MNQIKDKGYDPLSFSYPEHDFSKNFAHHHQPTYLCYTLNNKTIEGEIRQ